ncbi:cache domain-containing protein [Aquibacillus kalidii]|uniref:cache domain-containing protein n=1 Tax=Aquibacillus kalidii TaxID=2762597 RepID=UPI001644F5A4|nr:cache domain-containing protein [Aquibacillus kalidii]
MFIKKSVKAKLFTSLLLVAIIPLILISAILYFNTNQGLESMMEKNLMASKETISEQLNDVSEDLLELTKSYANNPEFLQAYNSGERERLAEVVSPVFERLTTEHQIDVFEFGDENGTVFLRGHNLEKFGDDKSDVQAIQSALDNQAISGFEFGSSGLSVRAFVPLTYNDQVIGTLQTGLDGQVIKSITESLKGVQLNIMNMEGEVLVTSNEKSAGTRFDDSSIISKVKSGEEVSREASNNMEYYMPLYDPTNSEVIGVIQISQDASDINSLTIN